MSNYHIDNNGLAHFPGCNFPELLRCINNVLALRDFDQVLIVSKSIIAYPWHTTEKLICTLYGRNSAVFFLIDALDSYWRSIPLGGGPSNAMKNFKYKAQVYFNHYLIEAKARDITANGSQQAGLNLDV